MKTSPAFAAVLGAALSLLALGCTAQDTNTAQSAAGADAAAGDTAIAGQDAAPEDVPPDVRYHAWVYASDPKTDDGPTKVVLRAPTVDDGSLTGAYVQVSNCLQEEGGAEMKQGKFIIGHLCVEQQTVLPDADGSYLQVTPPDDTADPGDPFAEVQMYYHVNQMHDFFADQFGLHDLDFPLYSLVNVTMKTVMSAGKWQGFPNAAFMPKEAFAQFGMPEREDGAIIFGQYQSTDFCYDASVIYHEYTHAMVGTTRLSGVMVDQYGLDNLAGGMNEGFADYFSCSRRDSPIVGPYALTFAGDWYVRDLSKPRKCPDDLWSEMHADGKIIGSTMWELRGELGQELADTVILNALQQFSLQTNLEAASKLILAEAKKIDADTGSKTQKILNNHGMLGCQRAKEWAPFSVMSSSEHIGYSIESKSAMGGSSGKAFASGIPGYIQFWIQPPAGQTVAKLGITAGSQSGFGPGGGVDLAFSIRKGKRVELNMFGDGSLLADDQVAPQGTSKTAERQTFYVTGACLAPSTKTYLMMLNPSSSQAMVESMDIDWVDTVPTGAVVADCVK